MYYNNHNLYTVLLEAYPRPCSAFHWDLTFAILQMAIG